MGIDAQMFVKTRGEYTETQVRALAVDLCEAFGPERFWIGEDWPIYDAEHENVVAHGRHALQIVERYTQDGDDIVPEPGEVFIEAHLATRYYGEQYERGDIAFIINVAQWLEARIPDAVVFYGGDSSGVCAEPFNAQSRAKYWDHFCRLGHKPYRGGFGPMILTENVVRCGFCNISMVSCGGSRTYEFYYCPGCDKKAIQHADGRVVPVQKHRDFHQVDAATGLERAATTGEQTT